MTSINLFDALEICLQSLDQGADIESCLVRFPELADELRPILTAAVQARSISSKTVPVDVVRRNRARVLQAAAELREQKKAAPVAFLPFWRRKGFFGARFARLAISFAAVITFLLTGGTGLVNASTSALPGDHLYPVKRSWEGMRLIFVFDKHAKDELEHEFDNERVHEIEELYSEKRIAEVNFQGVVQQQKDQTWIIDGLNILIDEKTNFSPNILPGSLVQVLGETDDGHIKAKSIMLLATPGITPSPTSTSTGIPTWTPLPSSTPDIGNGDDQDNGASPTDTLEPTQGWDDSSDGVGTPTPGHKDGGDDGGSDGGSDNNSSPAPTSTGEHHDGGDDGGEHHGTRTPKPTENHDSSTGTPSSSDDH